MRAVTPRLGYLLLALVAVIAVAAGCGGDDDSADESADEPAAEPPDDVRMSDDGGGAPVFTLTSSAFSEGGEIPVEFTCDGANTSPPLTIGGVPDGTESLGLIVQDPDAADFVHWTVYDIAAGTMGVDEGSIPAGALEGATDFGTEGYGGPCPPEGDGSHRYVFQLEALSASPELSAGASPADVEDAFSAVSIDNTQLTGTYER